MNVIWYIHPSNQEDYVRILNEVTPQLDRAGISFHIARPDEDIARFIIGERDRG